MFNILDHESDSCRSGIVLKLWLSVTLFWKFYGQNRLVKIELYASVNSKPDHPPPATPGDSKILVAPGIGFSLLYLAGGQPWGS